MLRASLSEMSGSFGWSVAAASRSGFSDFGILDEGEAADSGGTRQESWPFAGASTGGLPAKNVDNPTEGHGPGRDQGSGQGELSYIPLVNFLGIYFILIAIFLYL